MKDHYLEHSFLRAHINKLFCSVLLSNSMKNGILENTKFCITVVGINCGYQYYDKCLWPR